MKYIFIILSLIICINIGYAFSPAYQDIYNTFTFQHMNYIYPEYIVSDTVTINVLQLSELTISANLNNPDTIISGSIGYFNFIVTNSGNYFDTILFSCSDFLNFNPKIYLDANNNKIFDVGDYLSDSAYNLNMNDTVSIIIELNIPTDSNSGLYDTIYFSAKSSYDTAVTKSVFDTYSIFNNIVRVKILSPLNYIDTIQQIITITGIATNVNNNDSVYYYVDDILNNTGKIISNSFNDTVMLNGTFDFVKVVVHNSQNDNGFDSVIIHYVGSPSVTITCPSNNYNTNVIIITVSGTTNQSIAGDTIEIYRNGELQSTTCIMAMNGDWSGTAALTGINDSIAVKLRTKYDLIAFDTIIINYFTLPIVSITTPQNNFITNTEIITVSGIALNVSNYDSVMIYVNGQQQSRTNVMNGIWSGTAALNTLNETITAILTTFLGDTSLYEIKIIFDTIPPYFSDTIPSDSTIISATLVSVKYFDYGSGIDTTSVQIFIDTGLGKINYSNIADISVDSIQLNMIILNNDTYYVSVIVSDKAGNSDTVIWKFIAYLGYKVSGNLIVEGRLNYSGCTVYLTNGVDTYQSISNETGNFTFEQIRNGTYFIYTYLKGYLKRKISNIIINNSDITGINIGLIFGGDLFNTGSIGLDDLVKLKSNLGKPAASAEDGDINNSGYTTIDDYTILIKNMNKVGEE